MPRWLAAPVSLLFWATCVLLVILWTLLIALYRLATLRSDPDRYKVGYLFHRIAVVAARLNPFWDFRVVDDVHPGPRRPYVFVANHASNADPFLVAMVPWEMKWLSKKSIFDIPLLGWMMRVAGDVEVDRGNKESARKAMAQMRERLDRKLSVLIFPQGTRSPDGTVGAFRDGAFRLAIEAGVDVVPLAVAGTAESLPKGSIAFKKTAATLTVLPPVSTKGLTVEDAAKLAEKVRAEIARVISAPSGSSGSLPPPPTEPAAVS
ncbi:MAG TPA: lysophospholipid acyltransferase family protein [Thermoanaerobaculia bacterium]|jgi:1-acyl-sn-glycerol-3-phosphate acyltransferase|nr:lysophospholipid acyltransferase family protein [Thermoanaerobaculia bacterium]